MNSCLTLSADPIWPTLAGAHARYSVGDDRVRRYRDGFAPMAAFRDRASADGRRLAALFKPGEMAYLADIDPAGPHWADWHLQRAVPAERQVWCGKLPPRVREVAGLVRLGLPDATRMAALAERAALGGPFGRRNVELGAFYGIERDGELVAMAGERLRADGHREIGSVATLPSHRGQGLATALVARLVADALAAGERPFLHVAAANPAARVYRRLGFRREREVLFFALSRRATLNNM
jgi:ribosomal protein S18 acetylase RimI-like enzyme